MLRVSWWQASDGRRQGIAVWIHLRQERRVGTIGGVETVHRSFLAKGPVGYALQGFGG